MLNEDSIQFAIENTEIILAPQSRIETFGSTIFRFYLVSELMDTVGQVRVRDGKLHAVQQRPARTAMVNFAARNGSGVTLAKAWPDHRSDGGDVIIDGAFGLREGWRRPQQHEKHRDAAASKVHKRIITP